VADMDSSRSSGDGRTGFQLVASDDFGCGPTNICKQCGVEKPVDEFHRDSTMVLGVKNVCKLCSSQYSKARNRSKKLPNSDIPNRIIDRAAHILLERMGL